MKKIELYFENSQLWFQWLSRFIVLLSLGLIVFLVFNHFRPLLPETMDFWARISFTILLLVSTIVVRQRKKGKHYWQIPFTFFIASAAISMDLYLSHWLPGILSIRLDTPIGQTLDKLESSFIVVATIIVCTKISGGDMSSIYLKKGRVKQWLSIGIAVFTVFVVAGIPLAELLFQGKGLGVERVMPWIPWVLLFVVANAFNEELLFRGLFLQKLQPFLGRSGSNLLIAIVFTLMHAGVDYTSDALVFSLILFPVGLIMGYVVQRTDSIWGSVLIHAAIDIPVVLGLFSNLT